MTLLNFRTLPVWLMMHLLINLLGVLAPERGSMNAEQVQERKLMHIHPLVYFYLSVAAWHLRLHKLHGKLHRAWLKAHCAKFQRDINSTP